MHDLHSIRRARFDVHMRAGGSEQQVLERLEALWGQHVLPALDRCFDELPAAGTLELDCLEIDLGAVDLDAPVGQFEAAIRHALRGLGARGPGCANNGTRSPLRVALEEFLVTGTLDWRIPGGLVELERRLMVDSAVERDLAAALRDLLRARSVRTRISAQFSVRFQHWLADLLSLPPTVPEPGVMTRTSRNEFPFRMPSDRTHPIAPDRWLECLIPENREVQGPEGLTHSGARHGCGEASEKPEPLFVTGAGLPLLHPFIERLFERLGLSADGNFIDACSQERAVHLLQYLIDGEGEHQEPDLVVAKCLCGVELSRPLERTAELRAGERAECELVIDAAIEHWSRLKNTSRESFAQTFLRRNGRLDLGQEVRWLLIERSGVDVLLDTVPWSLESVALPWMPAPLHLAWC